MSVKDRILNNTLSFLGILWLGLSISLLNNESLADIIKR